MPWSRAGCDTVRRASIDAAPADREAFLRISNGNATPYVSVKPEEYQVMIDLARFIDQTRRRRS